MQDGSWKVLTDEREPYRTLREDVFDPAGNKVSSSETFTWEEGGAPITRIYYADGTFVRIAGSVDGSPGVLIQPPGQDPFEIPPDSEFFSHPAETIVGGGLAATETAAAQRLLGPAIAAPHTDELLRIINSGAKYTGPALAVAVALGDVMGAENASERCRASISGTPSVLGGIGSGAFAAPAGPIAAGLASALGSWTFGWVGSEIGRIVCY